MYDDTFVRIYSYPGDKCPACVKAKDLLTRHNISYTEIPVTKDCPHRKWLFAQGLMTVPQIFLDSTHIGGYGDLKQHLNPGGNKHAIDSLIGWLPEEPQRTKAEPQDTILRPATLETREKTESKTPNVVETLRKAERETKINDERTI